MDVLRKLLKPKQKQKDVILIFRFTTRLSVNNVFANMYINCRHGPSGLDAV